MAHSSSSTRAATTAEDSAGSQLSQALITRPSMQKKANDKCAVVIERQSLAQIYRMTGAAVTSSGFQGVQSLLDQFVNLNLISLDPFDPVVEMFIVACKHHAQTVELVDVKLVQEGRLLDRNCKLYVRRIAAVQKYVEHVASAIKRFQDDTASRKKPTASKERPENPPTNLENPHLHVADPVAENPGADAIVEFPMPMNSPQEEPEPEIMHEVHPEDAPVNIQPEPGHNVDTNTSRSTVSAMEGSESFVRHSNRKRKILFKVAEVIPHPTEAKRRALFVRNPVQVNDFVNNDVNLDAPEENPSQQCDILEPTVERDVVIVDCDGKLLTDGEIEALDKNHPTPLTVEKAFVNKVLATNISGMTMGDAFVKLVQDASNLLEQEQRLVFTVEHMQLQQTNPRDPGMSLKALKRNMNIAFLKIVNKYSCIPRLIFEHPKIKESLCKSIKMLQEKVSHQTRLSIAMLESEENQSAENNNETDDVKKTEHAVLKLIADEEDRQRRAVHNTGRNVNEEQPCANVNFANLSDEMVDSGFDSNFEPESPPMISASVQNGSRCPTFFLEDTGCCSSSNSRQSAGFEDMNEEFENEAIVPIKTIFNGMTEVSNKQAAMHFYSMLFHLNQKNMKIDFRPLYSDDADRVLRESVTKTHVETIKFKVDQYYGIVSGSASLDDDHQDLHLSTTAEGREILKTSQNGKF